VNRRDRDSSHLAIARITLSQFDGDLDQILKLPYAQAKKALKQFPNIGDRGAEKILMFWGGAPGLPLEWNGLRVLNRVGYGRAQKTYGAMCRSVQEALKDELPRKAEAIAQAHLRCASTEKKFAGTRTRNVTSARSIGYVHIPKSS
jgi:endonuclease III-like uncharacterized protein